MRWVEAEKVLQAKKIQGPIQNPGSTHLVTREAKMSRYYLNG